MFLPGRRCRVGTRNLVTAQAFIGRSRNCPLGQGLNLVSSETSLFRGGAWYFYGLKGIGWERAGMEGAGRGGSRERS
jgi:hypothetical protein